MRSLDSLAVSLLGVLMLFPILHARKSRASTRNSWPIVVHMDKASRGFTYKVDPHPKGYEPQDNLLRILDLVKEERGTNTPVIVLVDPRISFSEVWDFDGVADKAQLTNVHYFILNPATKVMAELKWGPTVPLSTNPPLK